MPLRSRMSLIMGQIEPERLELFALEFGKIAESDFVYTLASTNIDQSAPNLVKMYVTIRSQITSIIDLTVWVICPWICKNCWIWLWLYPSIYKCRPISTNHGHNINNNEILDEFDYGSNLTVTSGVICPWIQKNCLIWLCYSLASTNINHSAPNLVTMYISLRSHMSLIMGQVIPDQSVLSALEIEKLNFNSLSGIYPHC